MIRIRRGVIARFRQPKPWIGDRCKTVVREEPCCLGYADCHDHVVRCYEPISRLRYVLAGACAEHQGSAK